MQTIINAFISNFKSNTINWKSSKKYNTINWLWCREVNLRELLKKQKPIIIMYKYNISPLVFFISKSWKVDIDIFGPNFTWTLVNQFLFTKIRGSIFFSYLRFRTRHHKNKKKTKLKLEEWYTVKKQKHIRQINI